MNRTGKRAVALVALAVIVAGCSTDGATTKAGGEDAPVTLRLGTDGSQGRPEGNQMEEFARQVEQLSGGGVTIELVWEAADTATGEDPPGGVDQAVAGMVQEGELDMGMIPARAWDRMGVPTLQALTAPFLVTSNELTEQVTGGEIAEDMLAGLDEIGVTGLALMPDELRHFFAFGEPILSVSDVEGKTIRALRSDATYALIEALGAKADEPNGDVFFEGIESGQIVAAESSFVRAGTTLPARSTATGNLTLFPRVNSLVVNSDRFGELSDERQEVLRDAALGAREWAISTVVPDAEQAAAFCEVGGAVVLASAAEVAAFEAAAHPVYAELERDETTKDLIERIRELKSEIPAPTTPQPCESVEHEVVDPVEGNAADRAAFPDGVYRLDITQDDLRSLGATNPDDIKINYGTITWTLEDGQAHVTQASADATFTGAATYTVDGDDIAFDWDWAPELPPVTMSWRTEGDNLIFDVLGDWDPTIVAWYESHPWTKVG